MPIDSASSSDAQVLALLRAHPSVVTAEEGPNLLAFSQDGKPREVRQADPSADVFGLVELIDNNPLVCAHSASIPSPAGTLASIALGPLLLAGLIRRPPMLQLNVAGTPEDVLASLRSVAPIDQLRLLTPSEDPTTGPFVEGGLFGKSTRAQGLLAAQAAVEITESLSLSDVTAMYDERFGRSFYVRAETASGFIRPESLVGKPYATYRVGTTRATSGPTVFVEVAADPSGKPGAAGLIHAMNIMAGLEESMGIAG